MVFVGKKLAIFVHGCFWHRHSCRVGLRVPKTNVDYWVPKIQRNVERDEKHRETLKSDGWRVLVIWECETRDFEAISQKLGMFLTQS